MSGIGPTLGGVAATGLGEAVNRSSAPTIGEDLRSVATVSASALPLAEKFVSPKAVPHLGVPGKVFSFFGMMEGVRDALKGGSQAMSSFSRTGPEASNQAFEKGWKQAEDAGLSMEERSKAGQAAREREMAAGWAGVRQHGGEALGGIWKTGTNALDLAAPIPIGTGLDITARFSFAGMQHLAAQPVAVQQEFFERAFTFE